MKPMTLNLSKMKKIAGDKNTSTFQHPSGHRMVIVHSALPAVQRKQAIDMPVQSFSEGGTALSVATDPSSVALPEGLANPTNNNIIPGSDQPITVPEKLAQQYGISVDQAAQAIGMNQPQASAPQSVMASTPIPADTSAQSNQQFKLPTQYLQHERNSIEQGAKAEGWVGQQTANTLSELQTQLAQKQKTFDEGKLEQDKKQNELYDAIKNTQIDPKRWQHNQSTGAKIANAIGMALSGIGSGLTGQKNLAQENINRAIDQDIDAQKNDQSKNMTLWKMNRERMDSDAEAHAATRNQMLAGAKLDAETFMNAAQGPIAKAHAAQLIAGIDQQIELNKAFSTVTTGGAPGSESEFLNRMNAFQQLKPEYYKDLQGKYIPSIGVARIPVDEKTRESMVKLQSFQKDLNDAIKFQNQVGATGAWSPANRALAQSMKNSLTLKLGELSDLTRFTGEEKPLYQEIIGNIGGINPTGAEQVKLGQVNKNLQNKLSSLMQQHGVTPFQQASQKEQALQWVRQNPNDPRSAQIIQKLQSGAQ